MKNLLATCYGRAISDPRDAVFSILGLARGAPSFECNVDYNKSAVDVFMDAVENIALATESLDIICHSLWSENHAHSHSWVPRFAGGFEECRCEGFLTNSLTISEILVPDGGITQELMVDKSPYTAAGDTKAITTFNKALHQITVHGIKIDEVNGFLLFLSPIVVASKYLNSGKTKYSGI
ncbi:hypothetical protein G7Y89_g1189 [Cudoniella acicularis]|uniref:Uncharacterized protein n=1 Tax=Cudoniella acicularis TaxID=354080 RepID=A0A8H4RVR5_9HELO|nr:hypothetical protein G7Y89_g1189 [Cudoniella acicularis]